jgi:DNA-binding transcriptional regulator YiaG
MPTKASAKKTTFGGDLIQGMKLVLAHQRGKIELEQVWPKPVDVKAIRKRVKMSQAEFSRAYQPVVKVLPSRPDSFFHKVLCSVRNLPYN